MSEATITRDTLRRIIEEASEPCAERNREKLRRVADTTSWVTVGWFHCDGVGCPARQARVRHQGFQERFDRAMAEHFGREIREAPNPYITEPFVVRVL